VSISWAFGLAPACANRGLGENSFAHGQRTVTELNPPKVVGCESNVPLITAIPKATTAEAVLVLQGVNMSTTAQAGHSLYVSGRTYSKPRIPMIATEYLG